MILEGPKVYPESIVLDHIDEEDFTVYMPLETDVSFQTKSMNQGEGYADYDDEDEDYDDYEDNEEDGDDDEEEEGDEIDDLAQLKCSYAQLSAILALAGEKFKPMYGSKRPRSIPQKLCSKIIDNVIAYAKRYDLDREKEVQELLKPVERRLMRVSDRKDLKSLVPFYLGYTASLITFNPIPVIVGLGGSIRNIKKDGDVADNMRINSFQIKKRFVRRGTEEKSSLLDEQEDC